jgi:D-3-phosphoglycerate dehydrogenase
MSVRIFVPHLPAARATFLHPDVQKALGRIGEVIYAKEGESPWEVIPADVDAIVVGWGGPAKLPKSVWSNLPKLKAIGVLGGSPSGIEESIEAVERGIAIISASHAIAEAVAEETIGLMLAVRYELVNNACAFRASGRLVVDGNHRNRSIAGSKVGVIGFGHTGQQMAMRLRAFEPRLLIHDPYVSDEVIGQFEGQRVSLEELMAQSDIISVHAGWTTQSEGMINAALLGLIRPGTLVVSTARMPLFDEKALAALVREGKITFASDFVPFDETIWAGPDLHSRQNLIGVPGHTSITERTIEQMGLLVARDLEAIFSGKTPRHRITVEWIRHTTTRIPARH